jgi:hypothetical protein
LITVVIPIVEALHFAVAIAIVVGHFAAAVVVERVLGVILGEACSHLFEVNVFLVAASIPVHTFIFFVVASAETALNSLLGPFVFLAALRDTG